MLEEYKTLTASYSGGQLCHQKYKTKVFGTGVYVTVSRLEITIPYKGYKIKLVNEYGLSNAAIVEMQIIKGRLPNFEIISRSHIKNLLSFNKLYFVVKSNSIQYKLFLEKALESSGMVAIARKNLFEPTIKTEMIDCRLFIKTKYHLQLNNKIGAVKGLIDFYIEIINNLGK